MKFSSRVLATLALAAAVAASAARATQNELVPPTSGTYSGAQFSQLIGDAFRSLASCNKGSTAPANVSSAAVDGLCWIDDSSTPWLLKRYASGTWITIGAIDATNGYWVGRVGGGTTSLSSSSTVDLGSVSQANVTITGTTTITSFGATAPAGTVKFVRFSGALQITNSSNLEVPGGYDLTTAADDRMTVTALGSGAWEITQYTRADGVPIDVSAVGRISYGVWSSAPAHSVFGYGQALSRTTYPAYLAKVTRAQNATRTSGSTTLTLCCDGTMLGQGMPIEGSGIPAGTTISNIVGGTVTMSAAATSSGTSTATIFLTGYGSGGSSSTVGAPDCQGRVMVGRDDMSGTAQNRVTTSGSGINGIQIGAAGGDQTVTLAQTNIPNYTLPNTLGVTLGGVSGVVIGVGSGTASSVFQGGGGPNNAYASSVYTGLTTTVTGSVTSGGSGTAVNKMPPAFVANCIVRVEP